MINCISHVVFKFLMLVIFVLVGGCADVDAAGNISRSLDSNCAILSVYELARLDYEAIDDVCGGERYCYYSDAHALQPIKCFFGPDIHFLSYDRICGYASYSDGSRYVANLGQGMVYKVIVYGFGLDLPFETGSLTAIGLDVVWPSEVTVGIGGPGHAFIWEDIAGLPRIEMHSDEHLEFVERFVVWFEERRGMGFYQPWEEVQQLRAEDGCEIAYEFHASGGFCFE